MFQTIDFWYKPCQRMPLKIFKRFSYTFTPQQNSNNEHKGNDQRFEIIANKIRDVVKFKGQLFLVNQFLHLADLGWIEHC